MSTERPMAILQKASMLVQLLAERGPLTPGDIAEEIGVPRSSVYRLADALAQAQMVSNLPDARIKVNERWMRLADATRTGMGEWSQARRVLDDIGHATGQTVFLSVPRNDHAVCIDWTQGRGINVLILRPGRQLPLYAGAAGRVVLAYRQEPPDKYLHTQPFAKLTPRTLTTAPQLLQDIDVTRGRGYCHSDEDVTEGIGALGVPLLDRSNRLRGALSLAGLAEEINARQNEFVDRLRSGQSHLTEALR